MLLQMPSDAELYAALISRDADYDGRFCASVISIGILSTNLPCSQTQGWKIPLL